MRFNLFMIFAGLLFFFNPTYQMFDILPDFFGAILILFGLSKMYMYNADFEDAKKSARFVLWISVLKFVLCVWVNSGHRDYAMPFTFIICVLECIYFVAMAKALYKGAEYTLMRCDREIHVKSINEAFTMTFIFAIASKILEFLPHITDVFAQDTEYDLSAGASYKMSMAQMKAYVYFVVLIVGLILGLIYVFVISKTWIKLFADKKYSAYLKEKYDSYVELDHDAFMETRIRKIYFLFTVSFVFFIDFYIDGINVIPTFIGHLLLIFTLLYLAKYANISKAKILLVSLPSLVLSVVNYYYQYKVHLGKNYLYLVESYNYGEFKYLEKIDSVYVAGALSVAEYALAIVLMVMALCGMKKIFTFEKRKVALPMIKFAGIYGTLSLIAPIVRNVLSTLEAHLAVNEYVQDYVQNKAFLTNPKTYNDFMQNPLIRTYENVSLAAYITSFVAAALCLITMLYMLRMMRFTDGDK